MTDYTSDQELYASRRIARSLDLTPDGRPWVTGPWTRGPKTGPHRNAPIYVYDHDDCIVADTDSEEVATYIAHFHPERIKALVEEILNLRAEIAVRNEADFNELMADDDDE